MDSIDYSQAVVLSGGGAKGAYEVGVMKALFDGRCPSTGLKPLNPGVFTGTSVGSFNAAVMTSQSKVGADEGVRQLESIWLDRIADRHFDGSNAVFRVRWFPSAFLNPRSLLADPVLPLRQLTDDASFFVGDSWRRLTHLGRSTGALPRSLLDLLNLSSFLSLEPFRQLLRETIRPEDVLNSKRALRIAATNWKSGTLRVYRNSRGRGNPGQVRLDKDSVRTAIAASTAIPGIFPPIWVDGEPYVDGGAVMNTPLKPAILAGAEVLHVIFLDPELQNVQIGPVESTVQASGRLFALMLAVITNRDIAAAERINRVLSMRTSVKSAGGRGLRPLTIHRYQPGKDLGGILGLLDFTHSNLKDLVALGEQDAVNHDCKDSGCVVVR